MFLRKVYRYNKGLFAGMLFFIIMQLFVFYKHGMVFSPWYNYGMYSEVIKPQKEYAVYKVYADGKLLKGKDFSPQQWDDIHFALSQADAAACNEHFYESQIKRLFTKFHLPVAGKEHYINTLFDDAEIRALFEPHLAKKLHIKKVTIVPMLYQWNGSTLIETDSIGRIESNSVQCK